MASQPLVHTASAVRTVGLAGDVYAFLATGDQTDGRYALVEARVPPGGGPPPHIHSREVESFYILEGEITVHLGEQRVVATPGMFAHVPIGLLHSFRNESTQPARMLILLAPAGLEQMFLEVGTPLAAGATTAPPLEPADIQRLVAIAPKYGVELRPPQH